MSARFALKAEVDTAHDHLDRRMARLDLGDRADYSTFLKLHGAVLPALEEQLARGGLGQLIPSWESNRRTAALAADLAAMAVSPPPAITVDLDSQLETLLGAAYVLEGSRLGGQVLARQVPDDFPDAFLRGQGNIAPWPELIAALEQHLSSPEQLDRAKVAALAVFEAYSQSATRNGLNDDE